jgi:hypothetical protein
VSFIGFASGAWRRDSVVVAANRQAALSEASNNSAISIDDFIIDDEMPRLRYLSAERHLARRAGPFPFTGGRRAGTVREGWLRYLS